MIPQAIDDHLQHCLAKDSCDSSDIIQYAQSILAAEQAMQQQKMNYNSQYDALLPHYCKIADWMAQMPLGLHFKQRIVALQGNLNPTVKSSRDLEDYQNQVELISAFHTVLVPLIIRLQAEGARDQNAHAQLKKHAKSLQQKLTAIRALYPTSFAMIKDKFPQIVNNANAYVTTLFTQNVTKVRDSIELLAIVQAEHVNILQNASNMGESYRCYVRDKQSVPAGKLAPSAMDMLDRIKRLAYIVAEAPGVSALRNQVQNRNRIIHAVRGLQQKHGMDLVCPSLTRACQVGDPTYSAMEQALAQLAQNPYPGDTVIASFGAARICLIENLFGVSRVKKATETLASVKLFETKLLALMEPADNDFKMMTVSELEKLDGEIEVHVRACIAASAQVTKFLEEYQCVGNSTAIPSELQQLNTEARALPVALDAFVENIRERKLKVAERYSNVSRIKARLEQLVLSSEAFEKEALLFNQDLNACDVDVKNIARDNKQLLKESAHFIKRLQALKEERVRLNALTTSLVTEDDFKKWRVVVNQDDDFSKLFKHLNEQKIYYGVTLDDRFKRYESNLYDFTRAVAIYHWWHQIQQIKLTQDQVINKHRPNFQEQLQKIEIQQVTAGLLGTLRRLMPEDNVDLIDQFSSDTLSTEPEKHTQQLLMSLIEAADTSYDKSFQVAEKKYSLVVADPKKTSSSTKSRHKRAAAQAQPPVVTTAELNVVLANLQNSSSTSGKAAAVVSTTPSRKRSTSVPAKVESDLAVESGVNLSASLPLPSSSVDALHAEKLPPVQQSSGVVDGIPTASTTPSAPVKLTYLDRKTEASTTSSVPLVPTSVTSKDQASTLPPASRKVDNANFSAFKSATQKSGSMNGNLMSSSQTSQSEESSELVSSPASSMLTGPSARRNLFGRQENAAQSAVPGQGANDNSARRRDNSATLTGTNRAPAGAKCDPDHLPDDNLIVDLFPVNGYFNPNDPTKFEEKTFKDVMDENQFKVDHAAAMYHYQFREDGNVCQIMNRQNGLKSSDVTSPEFEPGPELLGAMRDSYIQRLSEGWTDFTLESPSPVVLARAQAFLAVQAKVLDVSINVQVECTNSQSLALLDWHDYVDRERSAWEDMKVQKVYEHRLQKYFSAVHFNRDLKGEMSQYQQDCSNRKIIFHGQHAANRANASLWQGGIPMYGQRGKQAAFLPDSVRSAPIVSNTQINTMVPTRA